MFWQQLSLGRQRTQQGSSLVEVLASLLILSVFVAVAMQSFVIAAMFKARADQYDRAVTWIQEDLEFVVNRAGEYEQNAYPYSSRCSAASAGGGLAAGLLSEIGGTPKIAGPRTLGGKAFTLTRTAVYATSTNPFKLLQLSYTVTPSGGGPAIATINTEVIPDAALKCP